MARHLTEAVAYYRTSSAANVGDDRDSLPRQRCAVSAFASCFAHSVLAQELGVLVMKARSVRGLTASGEDLTESDDPARNPPIFPDRTDWVTSAYRMLALTKRVGLVTKSYSLETTVVLSGVSSRHSNACWMPSATQ